MTGFYFDKDGALIDKDAEEAIDYGADWSDWFAASIDTADSIVASVWTGAAGIDVSAPQFEGLLTSCLIAGGTAGQVYGIANRITTAHGRTAVQRFRVKVV